MKKQNALLFSKKAVLRLLPRTSTLKRFPLLQFFRKVTACRRAFLVISPQPGTSIPVTLSEATVAVPPNLPNQPIHSMLQSVLQTNIVQRESILSLMKLLSTGDCTVDGACASANAAMTEKSLMEAAHDREKELLREVTDLQWRLMSAQEELQKCKTENAQAEF
ncbi:unnamed protein product [Coffea canephora]|uniref:Uncharacterized protein n=1 Tax=Coffea canephora TaxID=49390 RepID=A0A068TQH9_COFCA|nr:unnamed protein product [Coffea canephora]